MAEDKKCYKPKNFTVIRAIQLEVGNEDDVNCGNIISNGNRTVWSAIRSVIRRVINKIGRPRSGSPICLITSMITD